MLLTSSVFRTWSIKVMSEGLNTLLSGEWGGDVERMRVCRELRRVVGLC